MSGRGVRTVFVHIHVPKCGGTSFNEVLWRNFRLGFQMDYGRFSMLRPTADQLEWVLWRNPSIQAIAGHRFHTRLNYETPSHRIVAVTFVRDPVQHMASCYNFMRRMGYPGVSRLTMRRAVEWILGRGEVPDLKLPWVARGQVEHLDADRDLDRIEHVVGEGSLCVFPVERFDDACLLLGHRFPEHFRHTSFRVKNVTPRDQEPDSGVVELLHEHDRDSFTLHALALRWLDEALAEAMSPADLARARARQQRRNVYLASPLGEAGYIAGRVGDLTRRYLERRRWIGSGSGGKR
jgi:hypothetical protein